MPIVHSNASRDVTPNKIIAVKNFPVPKIQKNIKQFLGLAGYYRRFIDGFSKIASPLNQLLKKDIPDFSQPFILTTDASGFATGSILSQGNKGKDKPIAYASRSLSDTDNKI